MGSFLGLSEPASPVDRRPPTGRNNVWHHFGGSSRVVIFVHGFSDDSRDCWFNEAAQSYWPTRVRETAEFHDYSIYLGGYTTSKFGAGDYGIADCAKELFTSLGLPDGGRTRVLDHQALLFVCHSMGGIVVRYMLESQSRLFQDKTVGLALIASPSTGSGWADALIGIANTLGNEQVRTLATNSDLLKDLDRRFKALANAAAPAIPRLFGSEACETKGMKPGVPPIVSFESAGRYYDVTRLPDTDHRSCVKPDRDEHPAHTFLRTFVRDFETRFAAALPARRAVRLICGRLRRTVLIENEDGDAANEVGFVRIVGAPNGTYALRAVQQWSGYWSAPRLTLEGDATSPTVSLLNPDTASAELQFADSPQPDRPQNATYRYFSANAFSMSARELRLKTGRSDGIEFVGKRIGDEQVEELVFHVRLPEKMIVVGAPYVSVVRAPGEKHEKPDRAETDRTRPLLDYAPLLRTISWIVPRPMADLSYRVCWRLGDSPELPSTLSDDDRSGHQLLVDKLLWLRECTQKSERSPAEQQAVEQILGLLAHCGALLQGVLGDTPPAQHLELSLMVVDDSCASDDADGSDAATDDTRAAQLRIVAGTNATTIWRDSFPIGEGNAGRAVKKQAIRIFNLEKATRDPASFTYGYKPRPGHRPHQWLASFPLGAHGAVYAVFSLGTFNKAQVRLLRQLERGDLLARLAEQVQKAAERELALIHYS